MNSMSAGHPARGVKYSVSVLGVRATFCRAPRAEWCAAQSSIFPQAEVERPAIGDAEGVANYVRYVGHRVGIQIVLESEFAANFIANQTV